MNNKVLSKLKEIDDYIGAVAVEEAREVVNKIKESVESSSEMVKQEQIIDEDIKKLYNNIEQIKSFNKDISIYTDSM